jgi:uncharacterized membrane protein (DUF485 family)
MRARALATIARSLAVYVAIVAGAAAIGAVVGVLVLGEWFIGAGLAAWLAAWLALPIAPNTLVTRDVVLSRSRLRR